MSDGGPDGVGEVCDNLDGGGRREGSSLRVETHTTKARRSRPKHYLPARIGRTREARRNQRS